jgi:uncharacterized protein (DUF983 family)
VGLIIPVSTSETAPRCSSILFTGFIVCGAALVVEVKYSPSYWVHAILWLPSIAILVLGGLRLAKSTLMVLQYKHRAGEGRLDR